MNFYPFHIGDYASHTRHLSLIEDLAYRRLIDAYYLAEKPFSGEYNLIARSIGMRDYIDEVEYVLNKFFQYWQEDCTWRNKRADEEIAKYHAKADSARNANRVKLEKLSTLKSEMKSEAPQLLTKNQEPLTKNHINTIPAPVGVSLEVWNDFVLQRKKSKAVISENVIKTIAKEAAKANWSLEQALAECAARGWRGFKAEWVKDKQTQSERGNAVMLGLTRGLVGGGNNGLLSK
jgi:uncharacterized protein YdaU (DUF1376 family)